ncbi:MAG: pyruvate kinase [Firmicutes bacterium HGW-Firmicutes-2]|nr:MAG: pyruvate kinase [Firmicutes bacterium HGW-Firmicutes-2]
MHEKVKTGIVGFDNVIDQFRLGDNVVWQVDCLESYEKVLQPYVDQALQDQRKMVYIRFGAHRPLLKASEAIKVYEPSPEKGFESFATEVYNIVAREGLKTFYVFDVLTDLLQNWYSDLMIGNFFEVTCPFLYELDTIAYFAIMRNAHTYSTIATIRETTQLLLDVYQVKDNFYIHPLKVWKRYSPTMFFPHLIEADKVTCITASTESASLFSTIRLGEERLDYWDIVFNEARLALGVDDELRTKIKERLMKKLIGHESRMLDLCRRYFDLADILMIQSRTLGTGFIGGKSVGMLVARKIIEKEGEKALVDHLEHHDSFYLGSDIFYTYIVQNGWWQLRARQKTLEGYYKYASELKEKLMSGKFPENIKEKFMLMLEYFGQSPIIVRSSSLQEDNFGNAFAGKYESVFCVNQGTEEERYKAFENAVRKVYASTMNEEALEYRMNRGLFEQDEQMAILVQRVSGDFYEEDFFPHAAGVGNSSNLYVWDKSVDMEAGMLRLVFGLGTRAVDRTVVDYAKIVNLDQPSRVPPMNHEDEKKFSQHFVDVLSLKENKWKTKEMTLFANRELRVDQSLFFRPDEPMVKRLREMKRHDAPIPYILDMKNMVNKTDFPIIMRQILKLLSKTYAYPVDIEFTVNFRSEKNYMINLLQCRPLQTKGLGKTVEIPVIKNEKDCFFKSSGNFMGGNVHLPIEYVVYIKPKAYLELTEQKKYELARQIGQINKALKGKSAMLMGPGRFGTTTPSLGVPLNFQELCHMSVVCEMASIEAGFMPELSYGSHFFQDIVETGIFYIALFEGNDEVLLNMDQVITKENQLSTVLSNSEKWEDVIHVAHMEPLELYSDIVSQQLICL